MAETQHSTTWPELAIGLYDQLTGRSAQISYGFEKMHVYVPSGTGSKAEHAEWVLSGTIRISTKNRDSNPN